MRVSLITALVYLAETRQASVSEATYRSYVPQLAKHDIRDVTAGIEALACEPRGDFEPAFPALGTIIQRSEQARRKRTTPTKYVPCGSCMDGLVWVNAKGVPCDFLESTDRIMAECKCKREWKAAKRKAEEIA